VAAIAPDVLSATGSVALDDTDRYMTPAAGLPSFDRFEVDAIESGTGRRSAPLRAPACRCPIPLALNQDESCAKCGRRIRA
jgi:hypothetical protein